MMSAGVIGWPIAHSKSPLIHRFWLTKLGIDGDYGRFAVAPERLGDAVRALQALGLRGVNVTVPHKVAVMAHLNRIDPLAATVGAVNTVVVEDGALAGYNTDGVGFMEPLQSLPKDDLGFIGMAVIIGAGGAARAIATVMRNSGFDIDIYNRDLRKAEALAATLAPIAFAHQFPDRPDPNGEQIVLGTDIGREVKAYVLVNTTSLGMIGQPPLNLDFDLIHPDSIAYDIVYQPLETQFLRDARARGLRTIDGLAMLIGQAAAAFALFFGAPAPREHDAELRALLTYKPL